MKVTREIEVFVGHLKIGDRIEVDLPGEKHTATAIKEENDGMLFLLDEYLDEELPMNSDGSIQGGYDASELRKILQELAEAFPEELKKQMGTFENGDMLRLLTITEMFGVDENFHKCEGQIEWMKNCMHRIACVKNEGCAYGWTLTVVRGSYFATVKSNGDSDCDDAFYPHGVRPAFKILYP